MAYIFLDSAPVRTFPHPLTCSDFGILAVGGQLDVSSLLQAYTFGIFPWYNLGDPILWWYPQDRFIITHDTLHMPKSMRTYFNNPRYTITVNTSPENIIKRCSQVKRQGQAGTWITSEMIQAYVRLSKLDHLLSVEVWHKDILVGGLYGVLTGKIFSGESMFSIMPNASKYGFLYIAQALFDAGCMVIDCQQPTDYLKSLGGFSVTSTDYYRFIQRNLTHIIQGDVLTSTQFSLVK